MRNQGFEGTWQVTDRPSPIGEIAGHILTIGPDPDDPRGYEIVCEQHCATRNARGTDDPKRIVGDGFEIALDPDCQPLQEIHCRATRESNTGSWTAEDASGDPG